MLGHARLGAQDVVLSGAAGDANGPQQLAVPANGDAAACKPQPALADLDVYVFSVIGTLWAIF